MQHASSLSAALPEPALRLMKALAAGQAMPVSELAQRTGLPADGVRATLALLADRHWVGTLASGAHAYHYLTDEIPQAARDAAVACPFALHARTRNTQLTALAAGRTCYGHAAGTLGIALAGALKARGFLLLTLEQAHITPTGKAWFASIGVEPPLMAAAKPCVDWSERVPHLGGRTGKALTSRLLALGWFCRRSHKRSLALTPSGRDALGAQTGLKVPDQCVSG